MSTMLEEILKLSVTERIVLVEAIWDSIPADPGGEELTEATKQMLDQRLAAHRSALSSGSSWEDVKARIQGRL